MTLKDKAGVVVHLQPGEWIDAATQLGCQHYRFTPEWAFVEPTPGVYDWYQADTCMEKIRQVAPVAPYATILLAPPHAAPDIAPITRTWPHYVPFVAPESIPKMQAFADALLARYPDLEYIGCDTETNLRQFWVGTPEEFANNVIKPLSTVVRDHGKKLVGPGTTIQKYESKLHYVQAKDHMMRILNLAKNYIDVICFHSYGRSAERVFDQINTFVAECGIGRMNLWLTETGHDELWNWRNEDWWNCILERFLTGEQRQLIRYRKYLDWLQSSKSDFIKRAYLWRAWDPIPNDNTAGLMRRDSKGAFVMKRAGEELKRRMG